MQNLTSLTVAIPTYNKEHYIKRCIDSVLKQNMPIKIVVIDNQSTDNTWNIINSYGDEIIKIQNNTNVGMGGNWNKCIDNCSTELLMILHADDELMDGALQSYLDFFTSNPEVGLIHAGSIFINEDTHKEFIAVSDSQIIRKHGIDALNKIIGDANIICSSVIVPKRIYDEVGYFLVDSLSSDIEMWARIGKKYDIGYIMNNTVRVYVNDSSTGKSSLLGRNVDVILKDWDMLNNKMISYYHLSDQKQAKKYSNKAIIAGLLMIMMAAYSAKQYGKIAQSVYYIFFRYNALFNPIVWHKFISIIKRRFVS
ncbi:glycosyltransferase [Candidatus Gracilibacteria bacterium]|nr:glycosyltransferase [Candidatus Gracilibacteria bacterium]